MTPAELKFTKTHEWVKIENSTVIVGITDYAQKSLGDLTFVELPETGKKMIKGQSCCVIESVKAASDIFAPVSGEIAEVNTELESHPELINSDPYKKAWLVKIKDFSADDMKDLMNAKDYDSFVESQE
jgi:glycine cleavage system H protein